MTAPDYKTLVKKYFYFCLLFFLGVIFSFAAVFYTMDPLQLFHPSGQRERLLLHNMRAQAAGVLNSLKPDSIILGTSMLENTSASEASKKLGGNFFNISVSGGNYALRAPMLRYALKTGLKNVIYSMDVYYLNCDDDVSSLPAYLYDNNPFNDLKYYATLANIVNLFKEDQGLSQADYDRPEAWSYNSFRRGLFGGIEKWVEQEENPVRDKNFVKELAIRAKAFPLSSRKELREPVREQKAREYVNKYLLDIIREHPETEFSLIIPPYSRYYYATLRRFNPIAFFIHQEVIRHLARIAKEYKNIHVYGFEDQEFLDDLANYTDMLHYHPKYNSMFLDAIAAGKNELTPENVEEYLKRCEELAWNYDIPAIYQKVKHLFKPNQEIDNKSGNNLKS